MPVDKNDPGIGWTVQHEVVLPDGGDVAGQVFSPVQLPSRERQAVELGANYPDLFDAVGGRLEVIENEEELKAHPGGPEPGDLESNQALRAPVEAAQAAGQDNNVPAGVGNDYSIQVPSKVEDAEAVARVAKNKVEKSESPQTKDERKPTAKKSE